MLFSFGCVISGFRREDNEIYSLLRYHAVYTGNSLTTFREKQSVSSSRVEKLNNIFPLNFLSLEDDTDNLPRNVGKELPVYAG